MEKVARTRIRDIPRRRIVVLIAGAIVVAVAATSLGIYLTKEPTATDRVEQLNAVAAVDSHSDGSLRIVHLAADAQPKDVSAVVDAADTVRETRFTISIDTPDGTGQRQMQVRDGSHLQELTEVLFATATISGAFDLRTSWNIPGGGAWIEATSKEESLIAHPRLATEAMQVISASLDSDDTLHDGVSVIDLGVEFRHCEGADGGSWESAQSHMDGVAAILAEHDDVRANGWAGECDKAPTLELSAEHGQVSALWASLDTHLPQASVEVSTDDLAIHGSGGDDPTAGLELATELETLGANVESVTAKATTIEFSTTGEPDGIRDVIDAVDNDTTITWTQRYDGQSTDATARTVYWKGPAEQMSVIDEVRPIADTEECSLHVVVEDRIQWQFDADCKKLVEDAERRAPLFESLRAMDAHGMSQRLTLISGGLGDYVQFTWKPGGSADNVVVGDDVSLDTDELVKQFDDTAAT